MKQRFITPREQRSLDQLNAIQRKVAALDDLKMPELWKVWDVHFPRRPVHPNRKFLTSRLSHRFQELAFGTLPQSTRERLADYGQQLSKIKSKSPLKAVAIPGATLVREFDGKEYRVEVLADGRYEYNRQIYGSLSAIAKTITGTQWSGPAFFGLKAKGEA
jgi:Protein of unknown function (DUF2924)